MRTYLWGLWYVLQKRPNFPRIMTLLTRHRRWDNGEVKSSYWLGDARAKVCLRTEGSGGRSGRVGGWMCWTWRRVNDAGLRVEKLVKNPLSILFADSGSFLERCRMNSFLLVRILSSRTMCAKRRSALSICRSIVPFLSFAQRKRYVKTKLQTPIRRRSCPRGGDSVLVRLLGASKLRGRVELLSGQVSVGHVLRSWP
jgi:hypothetical protein